jgi:hypothetical protein
MTSKTYYEIKKNIDSGNYKLVRLVQEVEGQKLPEVIIEYNSVAGDSKKLANERLDFIRTKCNKFLPAGEYIVQCRMSKQNKSTIDQYNVTVTRAVVLTNNVEDKTKEQTTEMESIHLDEHIKLIHENARLTALITQLQFENEWYKKHGGSNPTTLADGSPIPKEKTGEELLSNVLSEALPGIMNLGDRYFGLEEKRLSLENNRIKSGLVKKGGMKKIVKKKTFEQQAQEEAAYMDKLQGDRFDREMDELEQDDPELYDAVCEILGIEEEEEEEDNMDLQDGEEEEEEEEEEE